MVNRDLTNEQQYQWWRHAIVNAAAIGETKLDMPTLSESLEMVDLNAIKKSYPDTEKPRIEDGGYTQTQKNKIRAVRKENPHMADWSSKDIFNSDTYAGSNTVGKLHGIQRMTPVAGLESTSLQRARMTQIRKKYPELTSIHWTEVIETDLYKEMYKGLKEK